MAKRATKVSIPTKTCIECKEVKVETEYLLYPTNHRANKCKKCTRDDRTARRAVGLKTCIECHEVKADTEYGRYKGKRAIKCITCTTNATAALEAIRSSKASKSSAKTKKCIGCLEEKSEAKFQLKRGRRGNKCRNCPVKTAKTLFQPKKCIGCLEEKLESKYPILPNGMRSKKCLRCPNTKTAARIAYDPSKKSKICKVCTQDRQMSDYWENTAIIGGHENTCITCRKNRKTELRVAAETKVHEPDATKICITCDEEKPVSEFRVCATLSGLRGCCHDCENLEVERMEFPTHKECSNCEVEQAAEEFYGARHHKDHLTSHCRICTDYRVHVRKDNLDEIRLKLKILAGKCSTPGCKFLHHPIFLEFAHWQRGTKPRTTSSGKQIVWSELVSETKIIDELKLGRFLCMLCHLVETVNEVAEVADAQRLANKTRMLAYMNKFKLQVGSCTDCQFAVTEAPMPYFHFDHLDGKTKLYNVSVARTPEAFDSEVKKCELVCKPCHKIRSAVRNVENGTAGVSSTFIA